jgi:hypothetical protein
MGNFPISVPELGRKFVDYRSTIFGDSFNWSWVRPLLQVQYLAIHHSAGPDTQTPDDIAAYHVRSRGWGGIGYHFVISKDGTVYYVGDITTARANVLNMNHLVLGICLIGNFTGGNNPSNEQINSAHLLSAKLLFNTPELPNVNGWEDVKGHKDFSPTACPGDAWPTIRQSIINATGGIDASKRSQEITDLYRIVLGREPDISGLNGYVASSLSIEAIRKSMTESTEHQSLLSRARNYKDAQNLAGEATSLVIQLKDKLDKIKNLGQ